MPIEERFCEASADGEADLNLKIVQSSKLKSSKLKIVPSLEV